LRSSAWIRPTPASGVRSIGVNPCNNRLPIAPLSPGITLRRRRSADAVSAWRSGVGRKDPAPDSGPLRVLHRPGPMTIREPHHDGAVVPAHPHTPQVCGSTGKHHRQRPRPFGPQPSRTHSCSLTRNGHGGQVGHQRTSP
jgi:hypothetical protein